MSESGRKYSKSQTEAIETFGQNVCVSAAAGSGKTSILVERFLFSVTEKKMDPCRILAITFTEKAANEMKTRLVAECRRRGLYEVRRLLESAYIHTIHGFCSRILKENPIESGVDPLFGILGEGEAEILMNTVLDRLFEEEAQNERWLSILSESGEENIRASIKNFYNLSRAMAEERAVYEGLENLKKEFVRICERFREAFDREKRSRASYDFDDLLFIVYRLLSSEAPEKKAVRERYRGHFSMILVDEYQDTSPLQDRIIGLLVKNDDLFLVGDLRQSIYGFRYADPEVFKSRMKAGGPNPVKNISLGENYRSRPDILSFVNGVFSRIAPSDFSGPLEPKTNFRYKKPVSVEVACVLQDDGEVSNAARARVVEARTLAALIRSWIDSGIKIEESGILRPIRYRDIAILMRSTTSSYLYEKELSDLGIPYYSLKGRNFYEKPEIMDLVNFLRIIENPRLDIPLAGVLRSPLGALSDDGLFWLAREAKRHHKETPLSAGLEKSETIDGFSPKDRARLEKFKILLEEFRSLKNRSKVSGVLETVLRRTDYEAKLLTQSNGRQKVANVRKLIEIASAWEERGIFGVEDFTGFLKALSDREVVESEASIETQESDSVVISSVHAAKGLEFPFVIVANMGTKPQNFDRGTFLSLPGIGLGMKLKDPKTQKKSADSAYQEIERHLKARESEEELRLLYVAMTRAKEHLVLSGFLADNSWMKKLVGAIGWDPENLRRGEIRFNGVPVGIIPITPKKGVSEPVRVRKNETRPKDNAEAFFEEIQRRLRPVKKEYKETEDATVTDLLSASLADEEPILPSLLPDDGAELPRNEYGTLFHGILEALVKRKMKKLSKITLKPFLGQVLSGAQAKEMEADVLRFWNGTLADAIRKARCVYPELPFIYKTRYGLLKGQMDLVFQDSEGRWVLLDYKTNRLESSSKEALAKEYEFQLALYAFVFRRLYGEGPERGVLYFSSIGQTHEFVYREEDFARIEARLEEVYARVLKR